MPAQQAPSLRRPHAAARSARRRPPPAPTLAARDAQVSEAKSLLEQTTLVCQGRPFYPSALSYMKDYVKKDLRRLDIPPAQLLSSKPMDDPLEAIMYITSVGVPSIVYETVRALRQAPRSRAHAHYSLLLLCRGARMVPRGTESTILHARALPFAPPGARPR